MPGIAVVRPADANETAEAWRWALLQRRQPVALILTRQKLAVLAGTKERAREGVARGAYVLVDAQGSKPDAIVIATGSEVGLAVDAAKALAARSIRVRVVSMPCWSTFAAQDASYRESVLPSSVRARVSVEAGATFGWSQWIGERGIAIGIDRYGASAPAETIFEKLGITAQHVAAAIEHALGKES
jgi:transketolase